MRVCFATLACVSLAFGGWAGELFEDVEFLRGFNVSAARHPAPKIELGPLVFADGPDEAPAWRLAQWGTNHLLEPGAFTAAGEASYAAQTPGKRVVVERTGRGAPSILLEVNGEAEFGDHYRQGGEFWPHLLIEQKFEPPLGLSEQEGLRLGLEFRVPFCDVVPGMEAGLDNSLHTAQVSAYFTVHNVNRESADHGGMIWFGIPLFDARHDVPPGHYALDIAPGGGGKFISTLDGKLFWEGDTGDGEWRKLDEDLAELLSEALKISRQHGHLEQSCLEDLALTSFNLGWELPGPYNAAIEIRALRLRKNRSALSNNENL